MSSDGSITLTWADGDHVFRTRLGEWREIQTTCGCGLVEIMERLQTRRWRVDDVREPIRVALIGGGMIPPKATAIVKRYVDDRPLAESLPVALAILMAAIVGVPDDPPDGNRAKKEDEAPAPIAGTDASDSQSSMDREPSSDSLLARSTA